MPDPFSDLDSAGHEAIAATVQAMEKRAEDPSIWGITGEWMAAIQWPDNGVFVDIGAGSGTVARRVAAHYQGGRVVAVEPSEGMRKAAHDLAASQAEPLENLEFVTGRGEALPLEDGEADIALLQTVLSHVEEPAALVSEAARVLKPGGRLVVCDADFSKLCLELETGDPLGALAEAFKAEFVAQPHITAELRRLVSAQGIEIEHFDITNRLVFAGDGAKPWVDFTTRRFVARGVIGQELADALTSEYYRRAASDRLYGFMPMVTLIARKS